MRAYSLDDVHATRKQRDSWWTVFLVDPVACRLTVHVANHTAVTPNGLTCLSLALGLGAAVWFAAGQLVAGAALFYLSFMVDCMDGKIARLKGTGTVFGLWIDFVGDRIREICCATGLAFGQYAATGDLSYILLGAGVTVLDLFRYVNAPQMRRVREAVRENRLPRDAAETGAITPAGASLEDSIESQVGEDPTVQPPWGARQVLRRYRRLGRALGRHRVRPHLMSGIEFHAAVFVVAPLLGSRALLPVSTAAGALLLLNEIFLIYLLWLYTRTAAPAAPIPSAAPRLPA
ncbi:CDP-alcohol phosphatidyltransferase family protein [Planomonospora sp. ID67723]|uniref:CDP-alcohol phosphatidyltransferase family protein n=1 Tax=Planomonospora sp. ID67723 TaxID=2738134 RepID=UPI001A239A01|nr:CDP-alcohol phosphatidyltransferase family protein [Planomonospora sp. ID67723]MBG0827871.1 CDP-alcohol phosphatidyltransferase family protein [Planomonospora sp. ID67723]